MIRQRLIHVPVVLNIFSTIIINIIVTEKSLMSHYMYIWHYLLRTSPGTQLWKSYIWLFGISEELKRQNHINYPSRIYIDTYKEDSYPIKYTWAWWIWNNDSAISYSSCPKMLHLRLQDASEITCNKDHTGLTKLHLAESFFRHQYLWLLNSDAFHFNNKIVSHQLLRQLAESSVNWIKIRVLKLSWATQYILPLLGIHYAQKSRDHYLKSDSAFGR